MSSSPNSESTLSKPREIRTKVFTKYGMTFAYNLYEETVPEWEMKTQEGPNGVAIPEWVPTGKSVVTSYVVSATFRDDGLCQKPSPIMLYSTSDGPILGITILSTEDTLRLLDPCAVLFDGKSRLNLLPIFNVGRYIDIEKSALRASQAPSEILLAAYPGFLIQNRMSKYQLKPTTPFITTPELSNDAVE